MSAARATGAFPFPAGMLLAPEAPAGSALAQAVDALAAGRLPQTWPTEMIATELALRGQLNAALQSIGDADPFALYNRYVLDPGSADPGAVAASLPGPLAPLAPLVRFMAGEVDRPPAADADTDPVVTALVLAAQATAELDGGDPRIAVELLRRAAGEAQPCAPALAALLRGNAAAVAHERLGEISAARAELAAVLDALAGTDLPVARAELHYQLGTIEHEQAAESGAGLQAAMHEYYSALQLITRGSAPFLWASVQMNLSAAYLASPMSEASDSLRTGIAIAALRSALEVFTAEDHPAQWATATLNLANALVYAPSAKQGDNLVEAVELYEQVLAVRHRDGDPLGRARVLANQGNALAHLGIFGQAKAKLYEARFLFEEQLDHGAVMAVRSVLDEIAKRGVAA